MDPSWKYLVIVLAILFPQYISAFPNGIVEGSCTTMMPNHGVSDQNTTSPYSLTLSKDTYRAQENLTVTLHSTFDGVHFKGFMIQARNGSSKIPLGTFLTSGTDSQILTCDNRKSAASHTSNSLKTSVQVKWMAPSSKISNIQFRATVVQVKEIYWMNVRSQSLTYSSSGSQLLVPALSQFLLCSSVLIYYLLTC
ncbi:putative ferric-chelate reductase 1 [Rhinophrynus dorsalis]